MEQPQTFLACPFCGETEVQLNELGDGSYVADCYVCGAGTGAQASKEDAALEWNKRAGANGAHESQPREAVSSSELVRADAATRADSCENPQPTYADLWNAFVAGANEARQNPKADEKQFNHAADGYCKLIHAQKAPEMFESMSGKSPNYD